MSGFPINKPFTIINATLLEQFTKNGELDLLKKVNYTNFSNETLKKVYNNVSNYASNELNTDHYNYETTLKNIKECLDYLEKQIKSSRTWELEDYIIYNTCYAKNARETCIHKVFNKKTNEYIVLNCGEILGLLSGNEKMDFTHFTHSLDYIEPPKPQQK